MDLPVHRESLGELGDLVEFLGRSAEPTNLRWLAVELLVVCTHL
jgi:hypothetical protein